jgi:Carbohydrate family 9 binding domain-like
MKKKILIFTVAGCGSIFLASCGFVRGSPTPFLTPTPNLTMTALFSGGGDLVPTATQPVFVTATQPPLPTSTPLPTLTPFPPTSTATAIPPSPTATPVRPGGSFEAAFMSTPPKIDGVWDEWTSKAYPANSIVFGAGNWAGPEDLEPSFRIGWDNTNLYIAVKVIDDVYAQNATGENIYKGDSIELLLDNDLFGDYLSTSLSNDDYQLGISPGNPNVDGTKEAYLWFPAGQAGNRNQVKIAAVSSEGLYRVEASIPWSILGVSPSRGQEFGFALSVSDNDNTSQNVQQTLASSAKTRVLTNPTTWGSLVLK